MGTFVRRSRDVLFRVLSLPAFNLLHFVLQNSSLITKRLVCGNICHSQLQVQLIIQPFEELFFPLSINVNFIRCISRQIVELLNILSHAAVALFQIMEFFLLQTHHSG